MRSDTKFYWIFDGIVTWFANLVRAIKLGVREFCKVMFPNWQWARSLENEFPIIQFPSRIVFEEEGVDGDVRLSVREPGSYHVSFERNKKSLEPRKRNVVEALQLLSEFVVSDHLTYNDIVIEFKFDRDLDEKVEAVTVVDSVEEKESEQDRLARLVGTHTAETGI